MPPKKAKDLAGAPVYRMGHEEQVQLLSDALLREYMHRRGFRATLKAFDEERPRDDNTISSRAVMSDLMALRADDQQRMKGEGIETIMEMLCYLRVERRVEAEALTAEAEAPLPKVPARFAALEARLQERAARAAAKAKGKKVKSTPATMSSSTEVYGVNVHHAAKSKKKKHLPPPPATTHVVSDMTIDDLLGGAHGSSSSSDGADSDDERENKAGRLGTSKQGTSPHDKSAAASGGPKGGSPAAKPAWMELEERITHGGKGGGGDGSDDDDGGSGESVEENDDDAGAAASGDPFSAGLQDELSAAFQLFCGFDGGLPRTFTEQGFAFDESLDCNLIQWKPGGLDAVVAPLQAFVAAYYYEREVYVRQEQRQQDCLVRALSTSLEQAQPNPAKVVLVNGLWTLKKGAARLTRGELRQQADTPRVRCWTQLSSYEHVRDVLRDQLLTDTHWRKPKGCGLLNYVFSLILSRGVDVVRKELSAAAAPDERPSLLLSSSSSPTDCASFALANLVLAGRATPFRHNGVQDGNRVGYPGRLKCGMLVADTLGDPDTDSSLPPSVYTYSLEPLFPSWVLRHKGHYANLYMTKDTRHVFQQKLNLGGSASENVVYWDAATEDDVYALSLTVRSVSVGSFGGKGPRNAKSFVNAAIASLPVWSSAEVNWNDGAPLRD